MDMKKFVCSLLTYTFLTGSIAFGEPCGCVQSYKCQQPCESAQPCNDCAQPSEASQPCQSSEQVIATEHMFCEKEALSNEVVRTNLRNIICKGNVFKIVFDCDFKSECAKAGDKLSFSVPESVYTREGSLLIPSGSKITATVIRVETQKVPNKNARVYLKFGCLTLPDGSSSVMSAMPYTKDSSLKEGPWMTTGKLAASTVGLAAVGAGAATGFAFIAHPLKLGVAYAIGIPVGAGVGLLTGLMTPGLKYHAKAGEAIKIILCDNLCVSIQACP